MGGINLFLYVQDNPVNFVDPDGQMPQAIVAGIVSGAISGTIEGIKSGSVMTGIKAGLITGITNAVGVGVAATGVGGLGLGGAAAAYTNVIMHGIPLPPFGMILDLIHSSSPSPCN